MLQRSVVGWSIPSYKSRLFSSSSTFEKKIVWPTSLIEQLIVTFLLANSAKTCFWFKYTFLQKSSFFEFFTIWEENCVADIINPYQNLSNAKIDCEPFKKFVSCTHWACGKECNSTFWGLERSNFRRNSLVLINDATIKLPRLAVDLCKPFFFAPIWLVRKSLFWLFWELESLILTSRCCKM